MGEVIQRVPDPELVFGLVAPIGANIDECVNSLKEKLTAFGYKPISIRLTDLFKIIQKKLNLPIELKESRLDERYESYIKYGDALRARFDDESFLAALAVSQIVDHRSRSAASETSGPPQKNAFIIRQFKRKEETDLLRAVYGQLFFQISVYSKRSSRVDNLSKKIANSYNSADANSFRHIAEALVKTDENEVGNAHGQRVSDVFHEADFIASTDSISHSMGNQIGRFVDLIFGSNYISPTKIEYGLYTAKSASLRSIDLSRQVGSAIFTTQGEIISLGANEVPKAKGGTYWSDDGLDDRDFRRKIDSNEKRKRELLAEVVESLIPENERDAALSNPKIVRSQFMDALEYGRIIHAEMSAVCDAARLGRPLSGAILYCTTFPCHMCAKHIVASGISEVIFLEPYPKSLASDLHGDSIDIDGQTRGDFAEYNATKFRHFFGVSPRRYRDLFERKKRKDGSGKFVEWIGDQRRVNIDIKLPIYLQLEHHILEAVLVPSLSKVDMSLEDIGLKAQQR